MKGWTRLWMTGLLLLDRLLGTDLTERELARREAKVAAQEARLIAIRQRMAELDELLAITELELCLLYLRQRHLLRRDTWLRFAPAEAEAEEKGLDLVIEQLVKRGLASVRTEPLGEEAYIYHLRPDWTAIASRLAVYHEALDAEVTTWVQAQAAAQTITPAE